jgi:hypothetical protein
MQALAPLLQPNIKGADFFRKEKRRALPDLAGQNNARADVTLRLHFSMTRGGTLHECKFEE